jgi:uncharacterized protein YfaT (DUF1175 family)
MDYVQSFLNIILTFWPNRTSLHETHMLIGKDFNNAVPGDIQPRVKPDDPGRRSVIP